ncbi:MAG: hypothetical protein ABI134_14510 [Byssovorax sp.]
MRSILRNLLVVSLALPFPIAAGCTGQTFPPPEEGGVGGGPDFSSTTGGFSSFAATGGGFMPPGFWTKQYGDAEDQKAGAVAVNEAGDLALTGSARGTIDFGNIPWTGSPTDNDVFVAKLSREGQSQWSRRYGDSCAQNGRAVALAPTGDVLIAGDFCGKMDFGKTTIAAAAGEVDLFVALIDDIGEDVYSLRLGGAGSQVARAAVVDAKGNAILVGSFEEAFDDGSGAVASAGLDDAFVIKLDPTGKVLWSRRFGGLEADIARAVVVDPGGNVIVGGSFGDSVDFGGGPIVVPTGHSSAFVMALDPQGKHLWSRSFTGDHETVVNGLAASSSGLVAATGSFAGTTDFGSGPALSDGAEDAFLAVIKSDGQPLWERTFGGPQSQSGTGVAFGPNDDLAISGTSQDAIDFDTGDVSPGVPSPTPELLFLARFAGNGTFLTSRVFANVVPMESVGIGLDSQSGAVMVGSFQKTVEYEFGAIESAGGWDVLVSHSE